MEQQNDPWALASRRLRSTLGTASCSFTTMAAGTAAAVSGAIKDRSCAVAAGFWTRRPPFASSSLAVAEVPPQPEGAGGDGKPKRKKKKGKKHTAASFGRMTDEQKREVLSGLPPEELKALKAMCEKSVMENTPVTFDGRKTTLWKLAKEVAEEKRIHDVGGDEATLRDESRTVRNAKMPVSQLRGDAPKMQLRPDEEAALELDRVGTGQAFSPAPVVGMRFGGQRDFTFGLYARTKRAQHILEQKYAGRDPQEVLSKQEFYDDVMDSAAAIELTVMAMPVRQLPLEATVANVAARLRASMQQLVGSEEVPKPQAAALSNLSGGFTVRKLEGSGLLDNKGQVLKNSQFIFTVGHQRQLSIEAITSAPLRDRKAVLIGTYAEPQVSRALLEQFLGADPIDEDAKISVGRAMLFAANGFNFGYDAERRTPNQYLVDEETGEAALPKPEVEDIRASPDLFSLPLGAGRRRRHPPLLDGISSRRLAVRQERPAAVEAA